jgi:diguanylate cyclase (GGDEF)-like protein
MNKSARHYVPLTKEELHHFEQVIEGADYAGNPLTAEFTTLYEQLKRTIHHVEAVEHENSRLKTQLVEMNRSLDLASRIDPMTGLANRRDVMEKIEQEHSRAFRHQRTFSLILVDVDDFKQINEKYGVNVGDDVLVEIACVLRECVRSEDICSRWGGEEFLFLLPETAIEGALSVTQKINTTVAMTEFKVNRPGIRTSVSLGVCNYQPGQSVIDCINRVEHALLQAKQRGKNQYVVAE